MQGLHLLAEYAACTCPAAYLYEEKLLSQLCRQPTLAVGLQIVGEAWHTFPRHAQHPGGVTGTLLLAESHLAIHTWPEYQALTLDIYVCNFHGDNSNKAEALYQALYQTFQPQAVNVQRQVRCRPFFGQGQKI